jgi:hypothetical protein
MSGVARTAVKPVTETPEAAELKGDS